MPILYLLTNCRYRIEIEIVILKHHYYQCVVLLCITVHVTVILYYSLRQVCMIQDGELYDPFVHVARTVLKSYETPNTLLTSL